MIAACWAPRRLAVASCALTLALAPGGGPGLALADSPRPAAADIEDVVELSDGGFARGTIVEWVPGRALTLRTASGELKTYPARDIRSATRAGKAVASAATPSGGEAPPAALSGETDLGRVYARIPGPRLRVTVGANRTAVLQRRIRDDEDGVAYHLVCTTPCTLDVPALDRELYRVAADHAQPTAWFAVPTQPARVQAELSPLAWQLWPKGLALAGGLLAVVGGGLWALHETGATGSWSRTTGFVVGGTGGAMLLTAGVLYLVRPATRLVVEPLPTSGP